MGDDHHGVVGEGAGVLVARGEGLEHAGPGFGGAIFGFAGLVVGTGLVIADRTGAL